MFLDFKERFKKISGLSKKDRANLTDSLCFQDKELFKLESRYTSMMRQDSSHYGSMDKSYLYTRQFPDPDYVEYPIKLSKGLFVNFDDTCLYEVDSEIFQIAVNKAIDNKIPFEFKFSNYLKTKQRLREEPKRFIHDKFWNMWSNLRVELNEINLEAGEKNWCEILHEFTNIKKLNVTVPYAHQLESQENKRLKSIKEIIQDISQYNIKEIEMKFDQYYQLILTKDTLNSYVQYGDSLSKPSRNKHVGRRYREDWN